MSFIARLKAIFGARTDQALGQLEDPKASLDYSLTRLQASLRQISDSLVEVATARRNLETQRMQLEKAIAKRKVKIRHQRLEDGIVLTASTEELQKFVLKYADEAFSDFSEFHRRK